MKRTYLVNIREKDGTKYQAFIYAKDLSEAVNMNGVESVLQRVTRQEKSDLVENYGIGVYVTK